MPYSFDGNAIDIEHEPRLHDGTLWVPLRAVGAAMGGNADWDPDNKVAALYLGSRIATIKIGDPTVDVDGEKRTLNGEPHVFQGETWVPVRFFSEAMGYSLGVDLSTNQVDILTPTS